MRGLCAYLCLLVALAEAPDALAAKAANEEVIRQPSLLMFGEVVQALGISYSYSGHTGLGPSSSSSAMSENYSVSTIAAILDQHLLQAQIRGGISYQQQYKKGTSTLLNGVYDIAASAFDLSDHPVNFGSSRTTSLIANGFTPSYTLTTNNNQVSASLLNKLVPLNVFYTHSTTDSKGLPADYSSVSNSAGVTAHHDYHDISHTRFSVNYSSSQAQGVDSKLYALSFGNTVLLDRGHKYLLASSVDVSEAVAGKIPRSDLTLAEDLSCRFGAALTGSMHAQYNENSTLGIEGVNQSQNNKSVSASLSHRLYQSLSTTLSGSYSQGTFLGGDNSTYGGTAAVSYSKMLPAQSSLLVVGQARRMISSQNLAGSVVTQRQEPHTAGPGSRITPDVSGKLISVISIEQAVTGTVYTPLADYTIDEARNQIVISLNGAIVPDTNLIIAYTVEVNPSISFQTDGLSASATLSLFSGRYSVNGDFSRQSQSTLSGAATKQALVSSDTANLRVSANLSPTAFGAEYGMVHGTQESSSHLAGYVSHTRLFSDSSSFALNLRDTYSMLGAVGTQSSTSTENVASFSGSYNKKFFEWIDMVLSLSLDDSRNGAGYSDFLAFRAGFSGVFNQLRFTLTGQTLYRFSGSSTDGNDQLQFSITRYF